MAGVARWKSRNLYVVAHQVFFRRKRIVLAFEERLLEIPARTPAQHTAYFQVLAQDVAHHIRRIDALRGLLVMRAARGVNVMIARIPACFRWIDPTYQAE